jgi:glycosyltransferase involved in cell wall biosynthesis
MSFKISIITVTFNAEKFIEKTIQSIINQTYKNIEFIIVDGKSKDNTLKIIENYSTHIDKVISEKDSGIYDAMNKGIDLATGDFITFLNAGDDYIDNNVLFNLFENLDKDTNIVYADHISILNGKEKYRKAKKFNKNNLFKFLTTTVCHQAIFVKKEIAPKYNLKYKLKGELNWYFDILKNTNIKFLHRKMPIVYYLRGGVGETKYILNLKEILKVLYSHGGIVGVLKAYKFLIKYFIKILFIITGRYKFEN